MAQLEPDATGRFAATDANLDVLPGHFGKPGEHWVPGDPGQWVPPGHRQPAIYDSQSAPGQKPSELSGKGDETFLEIVGEMRDLHLLKSGGYGTGADPFANFTGVAAITGQRRYEYPIQRMVEKLTRCQSLLAQGRVDELGEEFTDIAGLAICAEALRRQDA